MARLTFYGGIKEIGGNKIPCKDRERKLLLDFGFPYKRYKQSCEEYLSQYYHHSKKHHPKMKEDTEC